MRLIARPPRKHHFNYDDVLEFERAVLSDPRVETARTNGIVPHAAFFATSALFKYLGSWGMRMTPVVPESRATRCDRTYFSVLMGPQFSRCMPHFMLPCRKGVYLFDVWPSVREDVLHFIEHFDLDVVFVSASQSADYLRARVTRADVRWMPEGVEPAGYRFRPTSEKDIDVLQLGRKYDGYHRAIVNELERRGITYLYEKTKGEVIFPERDDFIDGLARSRISICVPSSITHPDRSGDVETMTMRYLQSMASKCLIVGRAPQEMIDLFGYNPVVEIDEDAPVRQLLDILDDFDSYTDLVERNHRVLLQEHTWSHRWAAMSRVIFAEDDVSAPAVLRSTA